MDQQSVILSEMKVRIAKLLKLELMQQIDTPLAVVVGKCDAWIHLLGPGRRCTIPSPPDGSTWITCGYNGIQICVRQLIRGGLRRRLSPTRSRSASACCFSRSVHLATPRCGSGPGDYVARTRDN